MDINSPLFAFLSVIVCFLAFVGFVSLWIWWDLRKEKKAEKKFIDRLKKPDFKFLENATGLNIPEELKDFYRSDLICSGSSLKVHGTDFEIEFFEPIDREAYGTSQGRKTEISIANDGCGNQFLYDVSGSSGVVFYYHELGERTMIDKSLHEFQSRLERSFHMEKEG